MLLTIVITAIMFGWAGVFYFGSILPKKRSNAEDEFYRIMVDRNGDLFNTTINNQFDEFSYQQPFRPYTGKDEHDLGRA